MSTSKVHIEIKVTTNVIRVEIRTWKNEFVAAFTCMEHELRERLVRDWGADKPDTVEYAATINGVEAGPVYAAADNFEMDREMFK
jgi:hypothetical protein